MEDDSVAYTIKQTLPPDLEYRFLKMLDKWASYITIDNTTGRLVGYGIPKTQNENFMFWLYVSVMDSEE